MKRPRLTTSRGIPCSLSNLLTTRGYDYADIQDAIMFSRSAQQLADALNEITIWDTWTVQMDRPEAGVCRLRYTDRCENVEYLRLEY